jgi:enoyl-CoA hydratase
MSIVVAATSRRVSSANPARLVLAATKEIMRRAADWTEDDAWPEQEAIARRMLGPEDRREGLRAFTESGERPGQVASFLTHPAAWRKA